MGSIGGSNGPGTVELVWEGMAPGQEGDIGLKRDGGAAWLAGGHMNIPCVVKCHTTILTSHHPFLKIYYSYYDFSLN